MPRNHRCGRTRRDRPTGHRGQRGSHAPPRRVLSGVPGYLTVRFGHRPAEDLEHGLRVYLGVVCVQRVDHRGLGRLSGGVAAPATRIASGPRRPRPRCSVGLDRSRKQPTRSTARSFQSGPPPGSQPGSPEQATTGTQGGFLLPGRRLPWVRRLPAPGQIRKMCGNPAYLRVVIESIGHRHHER